MSQMLYQRDVYGKTLLELGRQDPNIVVFDADLSGSTRTALFAREFPERFFNFGVAEQNMMATAAGLASCKKTVFVSTFAMFATGRAWDQVRNTICYNGLNVKIVATHAGITVGEDGSSHQALEDIVLMCAIPNMKIIVPCDGPQTKDAVMAAYRLEGPCYVRLGRPKFSTIENKPEFVFGKGQTLKEGSDITIIACGVLIGEALIAASQLQQHNISARVINIHTIKPIDTQIIIKAAKETKGIVVCEEHTVIGGLASAVDEVVAENNPCPILRIGIRKRFGQSGESSQLLKEYKLTAPYIVESARTLL